MNNQRRKEIAKAQALIDEAKSILEQAQADEQDYYDNMPENMQSGERGEKAEQSASELQDAVDSLDSAVSAVENAVGA